MKLALIIVAAIVAAEILGVAILFAIHLCEKNDEQDEKGNADHNHDCLVEDCDFHADGEVDDRLRKWLEDNKLRGDVVTDQAVKEFMLNWIIADVCKQRPLIGESDIDREPQG